MMKKISRRSFLQASGVLAAMAALTACGGSQTETGKTADAHEAITFMAPYKEVEAFIEQVHSVYPEVNIENMVNKSKKNMAYTMLDATGAVDKKLAEKLAAIPAVIRVRIL